MENGARYMPVAERFGDRAHARFVRHNIMTACAMQSLLA